MIERLRLKNSFELLNEVYFKGWPNNHCWVNGESWPAVRGKLELMLFKGVMTQEAKGQAEESQCSVWQTQRHRSNSVKLSDFSAPPTTTMNSSHNVLSSMDRLSASLSTPLGSRTAMERDFDRKFMAGINLKTRAESSFSSAGASQVAKCQPALSTGFSSTSSHYSRASCTTSDYSQSSRRALQQDTTGSYSRSPISPASGKSYKTYNSYSSY